MNILKTYIPKQILWLLSLAVFLSLMRIALFESYSLIYILWNLFLALLPFLISYWLLKKAKEKKLKSIFLLIGGFCWLLLLPNAPYLVTDLIHIGVVHAVPALYDSVFLFVSAWVGILLGFHSIFHIEQIIKLKFSDFKTDLMIGIIIFLTAFGVYLGRFLRFNSWDIFINHFSVLKGIWKTLFSFTVNLQAYLYIFLFFIFIYVSYLAWKENQKA